MQGQPGTESAAKTPRRKPKEAAPTAAPARKTISARKKSASATSNPEPSVLAFHPTPEDVTGMIATAAYYFAAERNFEAGQELDDWLRAEQLIQSRLAGS